eukprot:s1066_g4.t2
MAGSVTDQEHVFGQHVLALKDILELRDVPSEGLAVQPGLQGFSIGDVTHAGNESLRRGVRSIDESLVVVEPGFHCPHLVDVDFGVVHRIWEGSSENVGNTGVSRHEDLAPTKPDPNGLLDVLCTPHIHAIVVLTRLVPPTLGDGEKTSAHARHDVAAIFEPIEEKCPVELPHAASDHHLHTNGIVVDFPGVRIQDGYQRNDHALIVLADVSQQRYVPAWNRSDVSI